MKISWLALLACIAATSACPAGEPIHLPAAAPLVRVDWQDPWSLPRRFRNHCSYDVTNARYYCSDHCGSDYQFFYCTRWSFGCCRLGSGYCGWDGLLRCRP